jgi:hemerythrin-like metal-binding protein
LLEKKGDCEETRSEIDELFYFLTDYFGTHFDDEEELQQESNYPDYKEHHKQHQKFIKRVKELKYDFLNQEQVDLEMLDELKEQITDWFVNHIAKTDTDLKKYIGAKED